MTLTAKGNGILKFHFQPQGISGTGLLTGTKYNGVGVTQEVVKVATGTVFNRVNNFRLIGQGPGNNMSIHENAHLTIGANGVVTSAHDNFRAGCK